MAPVSAAPPTGMSSVNGNGSRSRAHQRLTRSEFNHKPGRGAIEMNPNETALVLIEYQNEFTSPGGKLHDAVKGVMQKTDMLQNTVELVGKARTLGASIVWVPISFAPDYREMSQEPYGILKV